MQAYLVNRPGGPEVLERTTLAAPEPTNGRVIIAIRAFGLNRAEAVTRAGGSGDAVPFPKVIGIECVGEVVDAGGTDLQPGQTVAAAMGGMGRAYHGSYAEMTSVPRSNVFPITTSLSWPDIGALPETFFTALGCVSVSRALDHPSPRVLVRPGSSALGLAIAQIVNASGGEVIGITRSESKVDRMLSGGMGHVIVASGAVADQVRGRWSDGATAVVDTVASDVSLTDDLALKADGAVVCVAGSLAHSYGTDAVDTVGQVMARDDVDFYSSETLDSAVDTAKLQAIVDAVEAGTYATGIDEVVGFDDLPEAHVKMEENAYSGKVVVDLTR
ncbi:MAG: zinc-binding dehydrogenase [Actinomycetota bacterium]